MFATERRTAVPNAALPSREFRIHSTNFVPCILSTLPTTPAKVKRVFVDRIRKQTAAIRLDALFFDLEIADSDSLVKVDARNSIDLNRFVTVPGTVGAYYVDPIFADVQ